MISPPRHPATDLLADTGVLQACANCGQPVAERYCGFCGQSRHDHSRSLVQIVAELLEHHLFLDGKMMRTLVALLLRPGVLTRAFIEGRRVRYVSPIRLYLFSSVTFFFVLWISGFAVIQFHLPPRALSILAGTGEATPTATEAAPGETNDTLLVEVLRPAREGQALPEGVKTNLGKSLKLDDEARQSPDGEKVMRFLDRLGDGANLVLTHPRALNPVLDEWLPRLLIVTLPVTALLLALFGRKRGLYFVDHIAFALHMQAFFFVVGLLVILLRFVAPTAALGWPLFVAGALYTYIAYLRTYPGNWFWAAVKLSIIACIYGGLLMSELIGLLVYGVSTVSGV